MPSPTEINQRVFWKNFLKAYPHLTSEERRFLGTAIRDGHSVGKVPALPAILRPYFSSQRSKIGLRTEGRLVFHSDILRVGKRTVDTGALKKLPMLLGYIPFSFLEAPENFKRYRILLEDFPGRSELYVGEKELFIKGPGDRILIDPISLAPFFLADVYHTVLSRAGPRACRVSGSTKTLSLSIFELLTETEPGDFDITSRVMSIFREAGYLDGDCRHLTLAGIKLFSSDIASRDQKVFNLFKQRCGDSLFIPVASRGNRGERLHNLDETIFEYLSPLDFTGGYSDFEKTRTRFFETYYFALCFRESPPLSFRDRALGGGAVLSPDFSILVDRPLHVLETLRRLSLLSFYESGPYLMSFSMTPESIAQAVYLGIPREDVITFLENRVERRGISLLKRVRRWGERVKEIKVRPAILTKDVNGRVKILSEGTDSIEEQLSAIEEMPRLEDS